MKRKIVCGIVLAVCTLVCCGASFASDRLDLSIYDIQHTTTDGDASFYDDQTHNVAGGIVTYISASKQRVYLRDPSQPTWGAICVKDGTDSGDPDNLFASVSLGDWVSLQGVHVEEKRGTTFLQYRNYDMGMAATHAVESSGNPVPVPTLLAAADLVIPVDHPASEPYESMMITMEDVIVGELDLGKADDNYELLQSGDTAWGADYYNEDAGATYDPHIFTGAHLDSITGFVEQYTKLSSGWDYYQLCTRLGSDVVPEPCTLGLLAAGLLFVVRRRPGTH